MRNVIAIILILFTANAFAHGAKLFVHVEGDTVVGKATYDDDKPVVHAKVAVFNSENTQVAHLTTDEEGIFRYEQNGHTNFSFTVTTPDGHQISYDGSEGKGDVEVSHVGDGTHVMDAESGDMVVILQRELAVLREDIHRLENTIRFHDVVGGIGYIVGVLGIIAFLKRRQG